jgi:hypothetical protein
MTRATTEGKGEFLVAHLPAGEYRVEVDMRCFPGLAPNSCAFVSGGGVE